MFSGKKHLKFHALVNNSFGHMDGSSIFTIHLHISVAMTSVVMRFLGTISDQLALVVQYTTLAVFSSIDQYNAMWNQRTDCTNTSSH